MSVDVVLNHHWRNEGRDYVPGDRVAVDDDLARSLATSGVASPATVADAKSVGAPSDEAASKKK